MRHLNFQSHSLEPTFIFFRNTASTAIVMVKGASSPASNSMTLLGANTLEWSQYRIDTANNSELDKITLVFQLEEMCGINVVAHKMKNVSGGI